MAKAGYSINTKTAHLINSGSAEIESIGMSNSLEFQYDLQQDAAVIDIATRNIFCLTPTNSLGQASRIMAEKGISSIVITDEANHPVGIVTERNVLNSLLSGHSQEAMLKDVMSSPVVTIPAATTWLDAYQAYIRSGVRHLVVVDDDTSLLGIVSETDFRRHINLAALAGRRQVSTAMSRSVFSMPPAGKLREALDMMRSHHESCVVVVEAGHPVGIITERDVVRLYSSDPEQTEIPVGKVMSSPVLTVSIDSSINEAAELMLKARVRHLVVVNHAGCDGRCHR